MNDRASNLINVDFYVPTVDQTFSFLFPYFTFPRTMIGVKLVTVSRTSVGSQEGVLSEPGVFEPFVRVRVLTYPPANSLIFRRDFPPNAPFPGRTGDVTLFSKDTQDPIQSLRTLPNKYLPRNGFAMCVVMSR